MLGQIERYVKQAICDNNDIVSSSALLCGLQLAPVRTSVLDRRAVVYVILAGVRLAWPCCGLNWVFVAAVLWPGSKRRTSCVDG